ncbi:response regulator transcription factor [Amnibacterium sp. CER49]|uniref:response regulator transcription factor n=1 Tax=Amnibacterium sp. CER49 TaxID=3039161 RepID=UPI00244823C8|nr:response regulator transcription factor [Amnibacterium sp. CER49]MDH2444364.1 response regulator transcription factor [Amnibacterium sp. CER49]
MNEDPTIRVLVADDHAGLRRRVADVLVAGGLEVVGEAASADAAVEAAERLKPDVALLDIHMPGSGIQAARRISESLPDTVVVMLTQSEDDADLFDSLRAGAAGYVLKAGNAAALPAALRRAVGGEAAIAPSLVTRVLGEFRNPKQGLFARRSPAGAKLSAREWEIMSMLADGRSTDEVAKTLFVSPTTVRVHVSTVLRKLQVKDRASAIQLLKTS